VIHSGQGDVDLYITINFYPGTLKIAELFVDVGKQGTTLQSMLDGWAIQTSVALQYGVPLAVIIEKFRDTVFPPDGRVTGLGIEKCSSLFDLIVQVLAQESGTSL